MKISIIVAMAKNRVIGKKGALPWQLPADLIHFKRLTLGHVIVMGRKTHESIGRALPGRKNVIITRSKDYTKPDCAVVYSVPEALSFARSVGEKEVFFIGGQEIYRAILPEANRLYVTLIGREFEGDVYFPAVDFSRWREISREEGIVDEKNPYPHTFLVFERQ